MSAFQAWRSASVPTNIVSVSIIIKFDGMFDNYQLNCKNSSYGSVDEIIIMAS
jgi:hypothetical protein